MQSFIVQGTMIFLAIWYYLPRIGFLGKDAVSFSCTPFLRKNMKITTVMSVVLLAGYGLFAHSAHALVDISAAPSAIVLTSDGSFDFGDKFKKNNHNAVFADRFDFSTTLASTMKLIVTSTSTNAGNGLSLTGLGLYDAHGLVVNGLQLRAGMDDVWTLSAANLLAGSYYVKVSGELLSNGGAAFGANGRITAVPEPESYAMLLGGLGLLGWMARLRTGAAKAI